MIARVIAWSARNLVLVLFGTGFAAAAGLYALVHLPLDAIPDLSDTQVIVYTEYPGQAPQVIEDQVTYPLTVSLQGLPGVRVVRSSSAFGFSMINVIFEDAIDLYFARSRVLERLQLLTKTLPAGVVPTLGPDATGVTRYGPIVIDPDRHRVTLNDEEVKLTAKEFLLLLYLVQHRGRVLSRDLLLTDVWGYQYTGGTRTVDVHVRRLREKLPVLADAIETVKQFGYKLAERP